MTTSTKHRKSKGFTLLEVLVALAIVAIGAVGILVLNNDIFRVVNETRTKDALALLAREVAHEHAVRLSAPVNKEGECNAPNEDCRWWIRSEDLPEDPTLALLRLTVDCGWNNTFTIESAIPAYGKAQ